MGNHNSGRRPVPTALKILRGNPGKRPLNAREPTPAPADPTFDDPPPELAGDAAAIAEWRRVAPMVRQAGIVSETDRAALVALCQQWSRYLEASRRVRRAGMLVKAADGPRVNPYLGIADRALAQCARLWPELGMTPSGRTRVSRLAPAQAPAPSKWAGLL